eukprot:2065561-Amphidinium_carterae.1
MRSRTPALAFFVPQRSEEQQNRKRGLISSSTLAPRGAALKTLRHKKACSSSAHQPRFHLRRADISCTGVNALVPRNRCCPLVVSP